MTFSATRLVTAGLVLCYFAAVLSQSSVSAEDCKHQGKQNNVTFGQASYYDRVLYTDKVSLKSKLWRVNTVDVTYPKSGTPSAGTISKIEITDLRKDGTGGCVYLANGGPGQRTVTLHFKTQRNHGLDFTVNIYGH